MNSTPYGALVIDDKINLVKYIDHPENIGDTTEFRNLRELQSFLFTKNIPLYTLSNLAENPAEAIQAIKDIPKIDFLILDLDLNSNGEFDEYDRNLLVAILKECINNFQNFF